MDTGTKLDQIAAVSRLLSGAYSDDAVRAAVEALRAALANTNTAQETV